MKPTSIYKYEEEIKCDECVRPDGYCLGTCYIQDTLNEDVAKIRGEEGQ